MAIYGHFPELKTTEPLMEIQIMQIYMWSPGESTRDGRFGSKVGQIGPQFGQIWDFFRSDFSTFWLAELICPIWSQSDSLWWGT